MADQTKHAIPLREAARRLRQMSSDAAALAHAIREIDWDSDSDVLGEVATRIEDVAHRDEDGEHLLALAKDLDSEADRMSGDA